MRMLNNAMQQFIHLRSFKEWEICDSMIHFDFFQKYQNLRKIEKDTKKAFQIYIPWQMFLGRWLVMRIWGYILQSPFEGDCLDHFFCWGLLISQLSWKGKWSEGVQPISIKSTQVVIHACIMRPNKFGKSKVVWTKVCQMQVCSHEC